MVNSNFSYFLYFNDCLIPVLGREQKDRMDISTYISITYIIGTGLAFSGKMVWEALHNATGIEYYTCARIVLALIALVCMLLPAFLIKERDYDQSEPVSENVFYLESDINNLIINDRFSLFDFIYFEGNFCDVSKKYFSLFGNKETKKISGYTSWYNNYQNINEAKILTDLKGIDNKNYDLFQIDDGAYEVVKLAVIK